MESFYSESLMIKDVRWLVAGIFCDHSLLEACVLRNADCQCGGLVELAIDGACLEATKHPCVNCGLNGANGCRHLSRRSRFHLRSNLFLSSMASPNNRRPSVPFPYYEGRQW